MSHPQRLLLVDDQPDNILVLYQIFRDEHKVHCASSGEEALAICRENPPDLILLDIMMPNTDGLETCRRLKMDGITRDIPVIFVTAQRNPEDETRALEAGGVDFISKPFNQAVVRARVRTHLTLKAQADLLKQIAFVDGLTGIPNRRRFDECLATEWRSCRRNRSPLTLLMIDIDHFKQYNDHYGHQEGDTCLRKVAATLAGRACRPHDIAARYGGEEFVCLLPQCDLESGRAKGEEIGRAVQALGIPHSCSTMAPVVTISIGVATLYPDKEDGMDKLVAKADTALYQAKKSGRNRVCVNNDPPA